MNKRAMVLLAAGAVALVLLWVFWKPRCRRGEGFMAGAPPHAKDLVIRDANDKIVYNNAKNAATAKVITLPVKCTLEAKTVYGYDDDVTSQKDIEQHEKEIKRLTDDIKRLTGQLKDHEAQLEKKKKKKK